MEPLSRLSLSSHHLFLAGNDMLDPFETEVIQRILRIVKEDTRPNRRRMPIWIPTLFNCCLLSRRMRDIAQPILWENLSLVWEWQTDAAQRALQLPSTAERRIEEVNVVRFPLPREKVTVLLETLRLENTVRSASLKGEWPVQSLPQEWLESLANSSALRTLSLSAWNELHADLPTFSSLTSLNLLSVDLLREALPRLLSTAVFPSLQCLSLHGFRSDGYSMDGESPLSPPTVDPSFLDQLDLLLVGISSHRPGTPLPAYTSESTPVVYTFRVLVNGLDENGRLPALLGSHTSHILCLSLVDVWGADADETFLSTLAASIAVSSLETLFLPHNLSSLVRQDVPDRDVQIEQLFSACEGKGIEVVRLSSGSSTRDFESWVGKKVEWLSLA